ncbi:hypothetical protein LCGC14_1052310 [marine sediment metagenome]|uniref:NAD-dependent epimerase/dehydratase domain-containing protein n=1 Tax=marine sediment metagenome TaxID=412755 RepID=A0A0F9NAB6_9ZZZZ
MKNILITGAKGFIGSNLIKRLKATEHCRIDECEFDINNYNMVNYYMFQDRSPIHEIYNFASTPSPSKFVKNPIRVLQTNTIGVNNLLEIALYKGSKFFQASTISVYGDSEELKNEGSYGMVRPIGVRSCYDEGKRAAEAYCWNYWDQHQVSIKIGRLGDCYGPGMSLDHGGVIPTFIKLALRNEPLGIYGNGYQYRTYCYIDDTIDGICRLMNNPFYSLMNLASKEYVSIVELADLILELTDSKSEVVFVKSRKEDITGRTIDISKAKTELGWEPKVKLEDGLKETITYFKGEME